MSPTEKANLLNQLNMKFSDQTAEATIASTKVSRKQQVLDMAMLINESTKAA
jgi:hypothetical protein